jgi:hypothetical protein
MDASIADLLGALQATQQAKAVAKLSERNVVELISKLKQLGILGEELLHTINGKEYITTDRLRADIKAALAQAGGRVELVELPALVGVDLVHCERQVATIISESAGSVVEAQGELITTQYFDSLAAEVNELLQESGVITLGDLAVQYSLNTELLVSTISSRVGAAPPAPPARTLAPAPASPCAARAWACAQPARRECRCRRRRCSARCGRARMPRASPTAAAHLGTSAPCRRWAPSSGATWSLGCCTPRPTCATSRRS